MLVVEPMEKWATNAADSDLRIHLARKNVGLADKEIIHVVVATEEEQVS